MKNENVSIWIDLKSVLLNLPQYTLVWVVGMLIAVLNDFAITAFALTGVLAGLATASVVLGLLAFLGLYSLMRIVSNHAEAVYAGLRPTSPSLSLPTRLDDE